MILNREQFERFSELRNQVYAAEGMIDGYYHVGAFDNDYEEIDKLHQETLDLLRKYEKVLGELIEKL